MPVIGVTGGISTGKSTFCDCLRALLPNAAFFDADKAAHDLVENDPEVKELIRSEFGDAIFSERGDLNRTQMRSIVFNDTEKKCALEQILHPRIRRQWSLESKNRRDSSDLFFADIPLLYETNGETLCDSVVVVACSPRVQLERLTARTGLDQFEATRMIHSQMPLAEKIRRADHVIWNNGSPTVLSAQAGVLAKRWQE